MNTPRSLKARYPYQFEGQPISMSFSRGWFDLFAQLCEDIDKTLGEDKRGFHWIQIKEKFGAVRVYYQIDPDTNDREPEIAQQLMDLTMAAEVTSEHVCASCGRPGSISGTSRWKLALCDEHRAQADAGTLSSVWLTEDES
jgi:hypothetical protein